MRAPAGLSLIRKLVCLIAGIPKSNRRFFDSPPPN